MTDHSTKSASMKAADRASEDAANREQAIHARYALLLNKIIFEGRQRVDKRRAAEHRGASDVMKAVEAVIEEFRTQ